MYTYDESLCYVMTKVVNCSLKVREFKLRSCYYIYILTNTIWKVMNPIMPTAMG